MRNTKTEQGNMGCTQHITKINDLQDAFPIRTELEEKHDPIAEIIRTRVILAPMSGITDIPFRLMARKFGCRFAFTEMVDVNGIIYRNRKTLQLLEAVPGDSPLGVQIVGRDEDKILRAAEECQSKGFTVLDINAGCPARKITKAGKGSALLKEPRKLGGIVRKLARNLSIPVTVKIRSGWDERNRNYLEVARLVEAEGASAICVHSRTSDQKYRGKADHEVTRAVKEAVDIPVFASGNIFSGRDAADVFEITGCDAIFVARGGLGRPWLFNEIYKFLEGEGPDSVPSFCEIKDAIIEHFCLSLRFHGEIRAFPRMYKHICWYLSGLKNLDHIMKEFGKLRSIAGFHGFMERLQMEGRRLVLAEGAAK